MALKLFLMRAPREYLDLPHFRKMAKVSSFHQKNSTRTQILGYAKNNCLAPGLITIFNFRS